MTFLEVSINNRLQSYAIDSILRIDREENGKAALILKSDPEFRILTDSMYNGLMLTLRQKNPLEDIAYIFSAFKPGIEKLLYRLNK